MVPKKIFYTKGVGVHREKLASFEMALRVSIGARTTIYPNVTIGAGARIGDDCVLHSQTAIRDRVVVGNRVILHNGVVLGSDGFGVARQRDGSHLKIPQAAAVVIEDDVEIGTGSRSAATCCSRRRSASPAARPSRTTS